MTPERIAKLIPQALTDYYGHKCKDFDDNCMCCQAWAELSRLTRERDEAFNAGIEAAAKVHTDEIPKIEKQIEVNNEYKKRTGNYDDTANELCRVAIYHHNWVLNAIRALLKDKP